MSPRTHRLPPRRGAWSHLGPSVEDWRTGTGITLPMVAVVIVCVVVFGPAAGAVAIFGALVSMWNPGGSLTRRLRRFAIICPLFPASMATGVLVSSWPWVALGAQAVLIFAITAAYHHFMTGPGPGPLHLFYASCIGGYLGATGHGWTAVEITAFATCLTAALTLLGVFGHRLQVRLWKRDGGSGSRYDWDFCGGNDLAEDCSGHSPTGSVPTLDEDVSPVAGPSAAVTGLRCSVAGLLAGSSAVLLSFDHSYWAVLSATIVLQGGQDTPATATRAMHRVLGTLGGVGIVALLALAHPGPAIQLLIIVLAVWGMNVIMAWHYAVAAAFITVMTLQANLLMLGEQATPALIVERLIATGFGVATALTVLACSTGTAHALIQKAGRFVERA